MSLHPIFEQLLKPWMPDDADTHEAKMRMFNAHRTADRLSVAPDCRDPEHIGCDKCEDEES